MLDPETMFPLTLSIVASEGPGAINDESIAAAWRRAEYIAEVVERVRGTPPPTPYDHAEATMRHPEYQRLTSDVDAGRLACWDDCADQEPPRKAEAVVYYLTDRNNPDAGGVLRPTCKRCARRLLTAPRPPQLHPHRTDAPVYTFDQSRDLKCWNPYGWHETPTPAVERVNMLFNGTPLSVVACRRCGVKLPHTPPTNPTLPPREVYTLPAAEEANA